MAENANDWLRKGNRVLVEGQLQIRQYTDSNGCLLYPSDAADERSSGDLGGRRIIKKKNVQH